jgi:hypothetical protein
VDDIASDIGFAVRTLRRRPAFAATAIVTLSLGIGATTAMFSVVDGVLLQPLPFKDPGRLVSLYTTFPDWKGQPVVRVLWNRLLGTDPLLGRTITVDEESFTIIGVSRPAFSLVGRRVETSGSPDAEIWMPFGIAPTMMQAGNHTMELIGRNCCS